MHLLTISLKIGPPKSRKIGPPKSRKIAMSETTRRKKINFNSMQMEITSDYPKADWVRPLELFDIHPDMSLQSCGRTSWFSLRYSWLGLRKRYK